MVSNRMTFRNNAAGKLRMEFNVLSANKECCLDAAFAEQVENLAGVRHRRSVVERERNVIRMRRALYERRTKHPRARHGRRIPEERAPEHGLYDQSDGAPDHHG